MLYAERKVDELYGCKHFDKDTPSYRVSHWGSVENQEDNFRRVADIISECGDVNSILDVGCGMGTIKQFLPKENKTVFLFEEYPFKFKEVKEWLNL